MMKTARKIQVGGEPAEKHSEEFRKRISAIAKRLETHNVLEEEHVYTWPALLFDEKMVVRLGERMQLELKNLPPRISESH